MTSSSRTEVPIWCFSIKNRNRILQITKVSPHHWKSTTTTEYFSLSTVELRRISYSAYSGRTGEPVRLASKPKVTIANLTEQKLEGICLSFTRRSKATLITETNIASVRIRLRFSCRLDRFGLSRRRKYFSIRSNAMPSRCFTLSVNRSRTLTFRTFKHRTPSGES